MKPCRQLAWRLVHSPSFSAKLLLVKNMAMHRIALATVLAIALVCIVATVLGALVAKRIISSVGNIKAVGVGVYSDSGCTIPVSYIDWGFLEPGSSKQFTVYVKNEGNVPIRLSMEVDNWNPSSASNYLTLS